MPRQAESRRRWARRPGYAVLRATGLAGLLALAGWMPAAGQEGAEAQVNADRLNFRQDCGTSSPVLAVLTRGETVTLLGTELGGWVRAEDADGVEGCVSARHLEIEPMAGTASAPSADPDPYAWVDRTDSESAEILSEIEALEQELEGTADPDEQAELREEIVRLESDLRTRHEELREERLEAAREAEEAALERQRRAVGEPENATTRSPRYAAVGQSDWTGLYLGVNAGYGFGDEVSARNNLGSSPEEDVDGGDFGLQVGYLHQFNSFVLGGEADYQFSGQSGSTDLGAIGFPGSTLEQEFESFGTVRVRAGLGMDRTLLYATAGYAYLKMDRNVEGPIAEQVSLDSVSFSGLAVGVGVEAMVTNHFSLRGEFLFHDFDDEPEVEDVAFFSARVGVSWLF